ncbi:GNAT family N-acetyltransferase [Synoicihabitans lomoniglobus]|uniref:GNAT family N-acetyltransferase n=1 Tax=Synoicihabitans lomoniglobus TaxID=2909285 RepID=A0AAF0CPA7_9BACT|nr:GNAT family N-acetyltransferase [Opitutaceae bacterium LMO-M01]WED63754.1 GNAT family N-acetyltransferase [Opitutaceae bacterium LMO-M01]
MSTPLLRVATPDDLPELAAIYIDAVQTLGPTAYTAAQVTAWASWPTAEPTEFRRRLTAGHTWVAEVEGQIAAFAVYVQPDHLDFLYTRGAYARRGLAMLLHEKLEAIARDLCAPLLRTEASYLSRPVFKKLGYRVMEIERVERFGETFTRFKMTKRLRVGAPTTGPDLAVIEAHAASFAVTPHVEAESVVTLRRHDPDNPGWFSGNDAGGVPGYFPTAWFEIDESTQQATAQRDYDAAELDVVVGDQVHVAETIGNWCLVVTHNGLHEGWIPAACLPATRE